MIELLNKKDDLISIIIPAMNEETSIGNVITQLKKTLKDYNYEIIVVDKSNDNTAKISTDSGARVISQEGYGYGCAIIQGFRAAAGNVLVMMDGDGTYAPEEIISLITPVIEGTADVVVGDRFANAKPGSMTPLNKIGNKILTLLINLLFSTKVKDSQSGYRAISKSAFNILHFYEKHMPFATEMLVEARRNKLKIKNIPISYEIRKGETKLNPLKDGTKIVVTCLRLVRDYNPLLFFSIPGIILSFAGVWVGVETLNVFQNSGIVYYGRALLTVFLSIIGIFLVFTGLILDSIKSYFNRWVIE